MNAGRKKLPEEKMRTLAAQMEAEMETALGVGKKKLPKEKMRTLAARMPESAALEIQRESGEIGVSTNAYLLMAIRQGRKLLGAQPAITIGGQRERGSDGKIH
jgi:hypothetical protein